MRFTGQVKIPDLDYPAVPASVQVDGNQIELFVEGESLGRWSLVDVRAERLISSAFSLKLAGEEVTFIADQPTEFAYGGVEAMATVWAKHRSMRLPLRIVANSRSRQGTKSSRIQDLRDAIEENLAVNAPTALDSARPPARKEASSIASLREPTGRRATEDETGDSTQAPTPVEDRGAEPEPVTHRAAAETSADVADTDSAEPDPRDPVPDSPDTPDAVFAEPKSEQMSEPPATDSVFKQSVPWAKSEKAETEDSPDLVAPVPASEESELTEQPIAEAPQPDEPEETPEPAAAQSGSVPWLAPPVADDPPAAAAATTSEPPPGDSKEIEPTRELEYVVDLGAFEDNDRTSEGGDDDDRGDDDSGDDEIVAARPAVVADDDEDASRPMATTAARGGIVGAVRSAFVRSRVEHTHDYVEAPGGLGIKRQICAECGHISIGVE